jgi:hypothetical protein
MIIEIPDTITLPILTFSVLGVLAIVGFMYIFRWFVLRSRTTNRHQKDRKDPQ